MNIEINVLAAVFKTELMDKMIVSVQNNIKRELKESNQKKIKILLSFILFLSFSLMSFGQNVSIDSAGNSKNNTKRTELSKAKKSEGEGSASEIFSATDTAIQVEKQNPRRAGLLSALLPGLGQAYNKKYWKIPIVYSAFATMFFLVEDNQHKYELFKRAFNGETVDAINLDYYSDEQIKEYKDYYKRNRDLTIIITCGLYLMNILDASVDAHLMDYDISEDLSLKIQPEYHNLYGYNKSDKKSGFGLKFVFSF